MKYQSISSLLSHESGPGLFSSTTETVQQQHGPKAESLHPMSSYLKNSPAHESILSGPGNPSPLQRGLLSPNSASAEEQLEQMFERVSSLLKPSIEASQNFIPVAPESLEQLGLTDEDLEKFSLKFLLQKGTATGRDISQQIRVPFRILSPLLKLWKDEQLITYRNTGEVGDYVFALTELGRSRAFKYREECTFCGSTPVGFHEYLKAMEHQTIAGRNITEQDLREAFADLQVSQTLLNQLGPAINSGQGIFLFGEPGNGKTSIAERLTLCFGESIWIPRTLGVDGEIIRLYDPQVHHEIKEAETGGLFDVSGVDPRWVRVRRPTLLVGGELTMSELEVNQNPVTKICEAPLQLKSNCGTLVIDDFGRQAMSVDTLLNRWIVPLEKRYDFLNLPSGKKIRVPFDQVLIFSTNLEPRGLVDDAFLRRIPYKIHVADPTVDEFKKLFNHVAQQMEIQLQADVVDYLIESHYVQKSRPLRNCHPRDLLSQVRSYCRYQNIPLRLTRQTADFAVESYFSMMAPV